ncbi:MAG: TROVE domain-containing protein [Myxococcales bacterium]|nr:TROVE domain-containing protein [Myxococcales bacterium]
MALFHRTKHRKLASHLNWMGGRSFAISDPLLRLRLAAASCFFGEPMYYHRDAADTRPRRRRSASALSDAALAHLRETLGAVDPQDWRGLAPAALLERAIDEALAHSVEQTLIEAVRLRKEALIRTTPQVILVRAANHPNARGTGLVRRYAPEILARADEPAVCLAYQLSRYGKPIPNALKRALRDALERYDDYQLAKYRMGARAETTVDVMNLVHPRGPAIDKLAKGALSLTGKTWEAIVSAPGDERARWQEALAVMGHMALLRNLRNLLAAGVAPAAFTKRLVKGAATGKQLPFRYYSAYQAVGPTAPGSVRDAIEQSLMASITNLPRFPGRVMSLCDNSGSAQSTTTSAMGTMKVSTIANLTGVLAAMRADDGYLGVFGDKLTVSSIRANASVFDQLGEAERAAQSIGMATENGIWLFWDQAIRARERWDTVFVFSDMQAGHGGLYGTNSRNYREYTWQGGSNIDVARLIAAYRAKVNPEVRVFLVQVAGYQDTIVPEHYYKTYVLGGWGPGLLGYAAEVAAIEDQAAQARA